MDRIEWFAEKATEIGLDFLTFLNCRFSERKVIKPERVERIVVSAMKQSLKYNKPVVGDMVDFKKFIAVERPGAKFIAHCNSELGEREYLGRLLKKGEKTLILIGPEGDFSPEEINFALQNGFKAISLGKERLRTETAAVVATVVTATINKM
jgi:16S rRNA (uracil1498-N3)-methyltransferase